MARTLTMSWSVVLRDVNPDRPSDYNNTHQVVAADVGEAEKKALEINGPVNNGIGYVYQLRAVSVRLLSAAH